MAEYNFDKLLKQWREIDTVIKKVSNSMAKLDEQTKKASSTGIKKQIERTNNLKTANQKLTEAQKKQIQISKQKQKQEDKTNLALQKNVAANRAAAKATADRAKALVALKNSEKGTKARLQANNRLLNLQLNTIKIGTKRYDAYTKAIFRNTAALKQHGKRVNQNFLNVGNYVKNGINKMKAGFAALSVGIFAALGVFRMLSRVFKSQLDAYDKQVAAEKSLEVALGKTSDALLKQASARQKLTRFGDEETIRSQAFLAQMKLEEDQILKIIPGIQDFAEAKGLDLAKASDLVAKSVGSSTNALSRYGIEIEGAAGSNERLNSAVAALSDKFEGQAEAAANVGTGGLKQLSNAIGDLKERLGGAIAQGLTPFAKGLTKLIQPGVTDDLEKQRIEVNKLTLRLSDSTTELKEREKILIALEAINPDIVKGLEAENLNYEQLTINAKLYNEEIVEKIRLALLDEEQTEKNIELAEQQNKVVKNRADVLEEIRKISPEIALSQATLNEKVAAANKLLGENVLSEKLSLKEKGKIAFQVTDLNVLMAKYNNSLEEENELLSDNNALRLRIALQERLNRAVGAAPIALKELSEENKKFFTTFIPKTKTKGTGKPAEKFDDQNLSFTPFGVDIPDAKTIDVVFKQTETLMQQASFDTRSRMQKYFDNLFTKQEGTTFFSRLLGVSGEDAEKIAATTVEAFNQAMSLIQQGLDRRRAANDEIISMSEERTNQLESELQSEKDRINELKASGAAFDLSEVKRLEKKLIAENKLKNKALEEEKKLKNQQKAIELTSAAINIAGSVLKAYNTPPPFNLILAAIMSGLGLAQLGIIASAKYADGTENVQLGGNKPGVDTVPSMLTAGEGVIKKDINTKIPYDKGFKHWMIPAAAEMFMNGGNHVYVNDNSESVKHLKNIDNNTSNNIIRDASGRIVYKKVGNHVINYN